MESVGSSSSSSSRVREERFEKDRRGRCRRRRESGASREQFPPDGDGDGDGGGGSGGGAVALAGHTFVSVHARTPTTKVGLMYGNVCGETEARIFPGTVPLFPPRYTHQLTIFPRQVGRLTSQLDTHHVPSLNDASSR
ncbi:hypothetical protein M0802_002795 [Mischocyttarus mexicanus]|nr:hypothetical protein M0802_002795 [Mischocyttarus mexicanus]